MHYRPDYPIVERKLSRVRVRRRSRHAGYNARGSHSSPSASRRQRRSTARPLQHRSAALGLAALCLVVALLYLALGAQQFLQPPPNPLSGKATTQQQNPPN